MRSAAIGLSLLLAACQGRSDADVQQEAPAAKAPALPGAPAASTDAARPEGADAIDTVLADTKAFTAEATAELAAVAQGEAKIRAAATRAMEASRSAEGVAEGVRQGLVGRVAAARREAETAHGGLVDGLTRFRGKATDARTRAEGAMEQCAGFEALAAYAPCTELTAEHERLVQATDALVARYEASEVAYRTERARLDEASAAIALAALK